MAQNKASKTWLKRSKSPFLQAKFNYTSPHLKFEGLTEKQTKLASYWNTPFSKICLGMKAKGETKWKVINYQATSLYNVIADGAFKNTTAGKDAWKSFINGTLRQDY